MWSERPSRRAVLGLIGASASAGALAGCGFAPVYAPGAPAGRLRGQVLPDPPGGKLAFTYVGQIEDRLGRAGDDAAFALSYLFDLRTVETAQTGFGNPLTLSLESPVEYALRARDSGAVLTSGRVTGFTTYADTGGSVAVEAAREDAEERLAVILADRTVTRLLATAPAWLP